VLQSRKKAAENEEGKIISKPKKEGRVQGIRRVGRTGRGVKGEGEGPTECLELLRGLAATRLRGSRGHQKWGAGRLGVVKSKRSFQWSIKVPCGGEVCFAQKTETPEADTIVAKKGNSGYNKAISPGVLLVLEKKKDKE